MAAGLQQPIGIFDSGIGGLTVANAVSTLLPNEQLVYFGDTAHLPYGDKSKELVCLYAATITNFLLQQKKCKAVVIACNTASAAAYNMLRDTYKGAVPVINVIDPMVEAVIADETIKKIGVIATKTTIESGVYKEKFNRRKPNLPYTEMATPLLAPMIEEKFYNNEISNAVIETYLSHPTLKDIDGLVLACTHYPLIKKQIAAYYGGKVKIFDSAEIVAHKLKLILEKENLLANEKTAADTFLVSCFTKSFEATTRVFYGKEIQLKENNIWKNLQ